MKSEQEKILGIVKELMKNSLKSGAEEINVRVINKTDHFQITIEDNGRGIEPDKLENVKRYLTQPRRDELEEYYGGLAGNSGAQIGGLNIVGMLVDQAEIDSTINVGTKIQVLRKKK